MLDSDASPEHWSWHIRLDGDLGPVGYLILMGSDDHLKTWYYSNNAFIWLITALHLFLWVGNFVYRVSWCGPGKAMKAKLSGILEKDQ